MFYYSNSNKLPSTYDLYIYTIQQYFYIHSVLQITKADSISIVLTDNKACNNSIHVFAMALVYENYLSFVCISGDTIQHKKMWCRSH